MKLRAAEGISSVRFHRALRANLRVESTTPTMAFCCTIASRCCETEQMSAENMRHRGMIQRDEETAKKEKPISTFVNIFVDRLETSFDSIEFNCCIKLFTY